MFWSAKTNILDFVSFKFTKLWATDSHALCSSDDMCVPSVREGLAPHLFPLSDVDRVHRAGADLISLLEKPRAGQELWVLVISILDSDGGTGADIVVLSSVHFLK